MSDSFLTPHGLDAVVRSSLGVWADGGINKVHQHDLRLAHARQPSGQDHANLAWDGAANAGTGQITSASAQNEYGVLFSLHIENAGATDVTGVSVTVQPLVGHGTAAGHRLSGRPAEVASVPTADPGERGRRLMHYVERDVEVFVVRYLKVAGLSLFSEGDVGGSHWERVCSRFQRQPPKYDWPSRPDHDTYYPEQCVPHEIMPTFTVAAGAQQEVLVAAYTGTDLPAGEYAGAVEVRVHGVVTRVIPVRHTVRPFALPDVPHLGTMIQISYAMVNARANGAFFAPDPGRVVYQYLLRCFTLLKRHKLTGFLDNAGYGTEYATAWCNGEILSGSCWTTNNSYQGYRGPGIGRGTGLWVDQHWADSSVHPKVSKLGPHTADEVRRMHAYADAAYAAVRKQAAGTSTEMLIYAYDEPGDDKIAGIDATCAEFAANSGPGRQIKTFCTSPPTARRRAALPHLNVFCAAWFGTWSPDGTTPYSQWIANMRSAGQEVWTYNGARPEAGAWHLEEPGMDHVVLMLNGARCGVQRHFFYEATYWFDFQNYGSGPYQVGVPHPAITQLWEDAQTFQGGRVAYNDQVGMTKTPLPGGDPGWSSTSNLDGVLLYPGLDVHAHDQARDNYHAACPFPGKRLFALSRGVQLVDYWQMARAVDAAAADAVLDTVAPAGWWQHWEAQYDRVAHAYRTRRPYHDEWRARWSEDADVAERARERWAAIIGGARR